MVPYCAISLVLALCLFFNTAHATEIKDIELKDGSVITGEVISLTNGIYTVKSDILGTIKLEDTKIRAIREKSSASTAVAVPHVSQAQSNAAGEAQSLQQKMMSDKEIMGMIQSLQNDPEFKALLEDPKIMKAVNTGDVAALSADPRFMKLMNNPTVREIQNKVK
jgi:hypothetical protein